MKQYLTIFHYTLFRYTHCLVIAMSQQSLNQFFGGKEPPAKKSKLTDEEKKQHAKEYELKHRKRKFCETWKEKRPWLKFDADSATMTCEFCIDSKVSNDNLFVAGHKSLKLENIKRHEESKEHKRSAEICAAKRSLPGASPAEKAINSLTKAQSERIGILMRNAHAIGKQARPLTDFNYLAKLDKAKNIDIGYQYLNNVACKGFMESIANVERRKIRDDFIEKAKWFSLMSDGSTDVSTIEEEIVYIRYVFKGQISVLFLGLKDVPKADARNIHSAICFLLEDVLGLKPDEWKPRLVGVASDGAAVMMGADNGVLRLLTDGRPDIITIHCLAHRLELAFKDAVKNIKLYNDLSSLLITIFKLYRRSPLNKSKVDSKFRQMIFVRSTLKI